MRKRFKIVLNLDIENPDDPFPAGGYYKHMNKLEGLIAGILSAVQSFWGLKYTVTLDKIIDKGEIE